MTTSISTHITTHFAYIEKEDKKFPLTEEQAFQLREVLKNSGPTKYVSIPDPRKPLGDPLWEGRAGSIQIQKAEKSNMSGAYYICDFGVHHAPHESCNCQEKYNISPIVFRGLLFAMYPDIKYRSEITSSIRNHILSIYKK